VDADAEFEGWRLLPTTAAEVPSAELIFPLEPSAGCVIAVRTSGTNYSKMAERARDTAESMLRALRHALSSTPLHESQLRFSLGQSYSLSSQVSGWKRRPGTAHELTLTQPLVTRVQAAPVMLLTGEPRNRLENKADLALQWMDRASLATEVVVKLLFLFFALEALLGDKSERLKALVLARRRMTLSHVNGAAFTHPDRTYLLYEHVRSKAVHGSDVPAIDEATLSAFELDVHAALDEYLNYARSAAFTKQSQLVQALDKHPDLPLLTAWLRANSGDFWAASLEES